jgi:hypothetical protein
LPVSKEKNPGCFQPGPTLSLADRKPCVRCYFNHVDQADIDAALEESFATRLESRYRALVLR